MTIEFDVLPEQRISKGVYRVRKRETVTITLSAEGSFVDDALFSIDNSKRDVVSVSASAVITDQAGTNPTFQLAMVGRVKDSGADFANLADNEQNAMDTSAEDISTADVTPVSLFFDSAEFKRNHFPSELSLRPVVGGTNTPTATGTITIEVLREFVQ